MTRDEQQTRTAEHVVLVSTRATAARARLTVRGASTAMPDATVHVLDLDGSYVPTEHELVHSPAGVGVDDGRLHRLAVVLTPDALGAALLPLLVRHVANTLSADAVVVPVLPGLILLQPPKELVAAAARHGLGLVPRTPGPPPDDGRRPDRADVAAAGTYHPGLLALRTDRTDLVDLWAAAASPGGAGTRWLDLAAASPHGAVPALPTLVSAWSLRADDVVADTEGVLTVDGAPVVAVDLVTVPDAAPWLLDPGLDGDPRARLSEHLVLAHWVAAATDRMRLDVVPEPSWDVATTSLGVAVDAPIRALFATAGSGAPDPYDPSASDALASWLTAPIEGGPGRYLGALHATRDDLVRSFPRVPGRDTAEFVAWVARHAVDEGYASELVDSSLGQLADVPRPAGRAVPGVEVVGFMRGELGIGESARLLVTALRAAGVPYRTRSVERHLASRQRPAATDPAEASHDLPFDTTIVCVNSDLTPSISETVPEVLDRSYRIGMWYWEVEDFPPSQHGGFAAVDEVWVATDFVRHAVEPHSPVPVRTVTPPLPRRRPLPPDLDRARLGLPPGFVFLFVFDYLSTFERKNPLGLVEAFTRAFPSGDGPMLVLKSINADKRPAEAEQLRLAVAHRSDVVLLEAYLDADERDALVALSDCYVSLHRAEGLGLTIAEAMAWGKPVVATRYSGNLQFMTDANSFLVPYSPATIPEDAAPYPAGGVWADPDLDAAAALLRLVVDDPDSARARGQRAASDIAELHSPAVAGAAVAARLSELASARRRRSRPGPVRALRGVAGRVRRAL